MLPIFHYVSEVNGMNLEFSIGKFKRRRWEFKGTQEGQEKFHRFFIGLYFTQVNIGSKEPLAVTFQIGPVKDDISIIIFPDIFYPTKHSFCSIAN